MPTACDAYTFDTGVVAGAEDGCTDGIVLNAQTDPSCDLKCDRANGFFGEPASLTCTDELGDISSTAPRCEPCQPQAGCSGEGKGKACSDTLSISTKLTCDTPDDGYTFIPNTDVVKRIARCGDREGLNVNNPVTDEQCGYGFVFNPASTQDECAGGTCDPSNIDADRAVSYA